MVLERVESYNYLGVILDMQMTMSPLLKKVIRIVSNKIYSLAKIRNTINMKCALTIYKQSILPLLLYRRYAIIYRYF